MLPQPTRKRWLHSNWCCKLEGIIPALEPSHALAHVMKIAPKLPADHLLVMNMCGRGDKDIFTVANILGSGTVSTRIDAKFAALKQEGRAALVTFITAGDPDYATSLKNRAGPAQGGC